MIFGRKKRRQAAQAKAEENKQAAPENLDETTPDAEPDQPDAQADAQAAREKAEAQWCKWDEEFEREEGPFDISEVDLDADQVQRLDLGTLVVTPFQNMNLQLLTDKQQVPQALVAKDEVSAIQVALFGAPSRTAYVPDARQEIIAAASRTQGARITVRKGPFGTEIARSVPVQSEDGTAGIQHIRTWLVQGPSWVLRGDVLGRAALEPTNEEATVAIEEFFANLVVRRGQDAVAPGAVIPFSMPKMPSKDPVES